MFNKLSVLVVCFCVFPELLGQNIDNNTLLDDPLTLEAPEHNFSYYYAAVVEFYQETNFSRSAKESLTKNADEYIEIIKYLRTNFTEPLDLIVFPESTLTDKSYPLSEVSTKIPPLFTTILCNSTDIHYKDFLKSLSCAAVEHNTVVVVNLVEKEECRFENCGENETFFNTDVVLGENGTVLARYRKFNLFGEYGITKPIDLDLPVFNIKNTTFGMMTCFDIQFGSPGLNLVKEKGVRNVIFPLRWISELPYLTALQTQQMWAQENNVVLLASGANMPGSGAGGSGIFFGSEGPLQYDIYGETKTKVIYQKIPIKMNVDNSVKNVTGITVENLDDIDVLAKDMDGFYMLFDPSIKDHHSEVVHINTTGLLNVNHQVCHGEPPNVICCSFNISLSMESHNLSSKNDKFYVYHMVAFNGIRTYSGLYDGGIEACGLIACLNDSVSSCGQRFSNYSEILWPITFHHVNITANFSQSESRIQFPTSLLSSIRPIAPNHTSWTRKTSDDGTVFRSHLLNIPQNRLLTFGIFGRDFSRDFDPIRNTTGSSTSNKAFSRSDLVCLIFAIFNGFLFIVINQEF